MSQTLLPYVLAVIVNNNNEVLLAQRKNSEWFNNYYGLIGGKIEQQESATQALAREVAEEIGITFDSDRAEFAHVMHFMGETEPCIALFFLIRTWQGELTNREPEKNDHISWFSLDKLPENLIPRHKKALKLISKKILYSEDNW
jgi:8-oxo-dGTP diphosphatase